MTGDLLLSFFVVMPAVVAVFKARDMQVKAAQTMMFWGGLVACLLAAAVVLPMLLCDGDLMSAYSNCAGGDGIGAMFNRLQPMILTGAKIYVLIGIPLGVLAFLIESLAARR